MKKSIILMAAAAILAVGCKSNNENTNQNDTTMNAQKETVGQFQAYELDGFKLHVYNSNDVMFDASYIIEGQNGLVVMEYPLFKVNAAEFAEYIKSLGKPVVTDITDYHLGGSDQLPIVMPEGMPKFIEGPIYGGMMKGFAEQFGETMVDLPTQQATEVPFGSTQQYAGVDFRFDRGAASDFPGSMILIGSQRILLLCCNRLADIIYRYRFLSDFILGFVVAFISRFSTCHSTIFIIPVFGNTNHMLSIWTSIPPTKREPCHYLPWLFNRDFY